MPLWGAHFATKELIFNRVIKALGRSAPKKKVSLGRKAKRYFRNPAEKCRRIGSSQALSLYIFFHGIMAVECLFHVFGLLDRGTQKEKRKILLNRIQLAVVIQFLALYLQENLQNYEI